MGTHLTTRTKSQDDYANRLQEACSKNVGSATPYQKL